MFKRKKNHKQNTHNPKPKKYKHETTWEESLKAKIIQEIESEYIEREKKLQQREHEVDQKKHEFEMKRKWAKDNTKKSYVNQSTEPKDISFSKSNLSQENFFFPKSNSLPFRNNLMNLRNLNL